MTTIPGGRRTAALLVAGAFAGAALAGCGGDGDGDGGEEFLPPATAAPSANAPSTTAEATTTTEGSAPPTTVPSAAERWVGTSWAPGSGTDLRPVVDGSPIELASVTGLCTDAGCERSLDLLGEPAPADVGPPPGTYVLWANRLIDRTPDGAPRWEVTDAIEVVLADGDGPILCAPADDPTQQVLGVIRLDPASTEAEVVPDRVWTVDGSGAIEEPDPSGYRCEVGAF